MSVLPLAVSLPNQQIIFNLLLFKYTVIFYLLVDTQLFTKPHIIYKVEMIYYPLSLSYILSLTLFISYQLLSTSR